MAVTTLYEDEFTEILSYFSERWRIHESRYTLSNTWRVNKPHKDETLKLVEDKLLFILYYFKNYHIQKTMGLNRVANRFGMSQGKAECRPVKHLDKGIITNSPRDFGKIW